MIRHTLHSYTGRANKKEPMGKIRYLWNGSEFFRKNLQCLQSRIQTTYSAKFIAIFGCIQKLQLFELNLNIHSSK